MFEYLLFVAFGWLVDTLEGEERSRAYTVSVGYFKGSSAGILAVSVKLVNSNTSDSQQASEIICHDVIYTVQ